MSNSSSSEIPSDSLYITLSVSNSIHDITSYYRRVSEGLFDDTGNANDPAPETVLGSLRLDYVRSLVLEHSTQGREAVLSVLWGTVESAQKEFGQVTENFQVKLEEAKALDSRWEKVNADEIRRSARNSELYQLCKKLLEARWTIPLMTTVTIPEPTPRASLGSGITTWEMFEYAKLESPKNTIRLVRMESISASLEPPIHITTRTVRLQDKVPYATLSYTWGNPFGVFCSEKDRDAAPRTDIPIICDGKVLEIGENLYRFLCRWRQALALFDETTRAYGVPDEMEESRPPAEFWIDAICINQGDIEEKNQQVSIMGDIYTKSVTTWVWLGEADQFSREAFGVLQTLNNQCHGADIESLQKLEKNELLARLGLPDMNSWKWLAVFALFQRQWFRRSWIVQEATLSSHILFQCGSVHVPGGFIVSAHINMQRFAFLGRLIGSVGMYEMRPTRLEFKMVGHHSERHAVLKKSSKEPSDLRCHPCREGIVADFTGVIAKIMRIKVLDPDILANDKNSLAVNNDVPPMNRVAALLDLWRLSRATLCGNLRDKVYALASLANRDTYRTPNTVRDRRALEPDYRKSVCEVYCEAAWFTVLTHANLDVLSMAGHISLNSEHDLPSWVPDLSQSPRFLSLNNYLEGNPGIGWLASGGARWEIPPPTMRYGRHLSAQVTFVGKIQDTDHEEPEYNSNEPYKPNFKQFLEFSKLLPPTYFGHPDGQSRFDVIWRTIIADVIDGISPAPPEYAVEFEKLCMEAFREAFDDFAIGNANNTDFIQTVAAMRDMGRLHDLSGSIEPLSIRTDETTRFRERVFATMDKRRLFMADTGHVGCGDARLSVGDLIVIIAGFSIPCLLRCGSGGSYTFIGEAYVHGIMFGEHAMKPDVEWESITLE